jgi:hypothetical protein
MGNYPAAKYLALVEAANSSSLAGTQQFAQRD